MHRKMPEFFEKSPLSWAEKHPDFQVTSWSSRRNIALSFRHALWVDRRLPELRKKLVFSVCRLLSRRCHNISSIYQSYSCPSQNRTSGFPIHTAPRLVIQYASVLRQGFRPLRMLPVGQSIQARAWRNDGQVYALRWLLRLSHLNNMRSTQ